MRSTDPKTIAKDVTTFLASLRTVPWFKNLGKPHPRDNDVVRIRSWDEWPGPEGGYGDAFGRWPAAVREIVEVEEAVRLGELTELWQRVYPLVVEVASRNVPGFDPKEDAWYGPTSCVHQAAYNSALISWHILLKRPIPEMIAGEWFWYSQGHWPCDFAEKPVGWDEALVDFHIKFLVY